MPRGQPLSGLIKNLEGNAVVGLQVAAEWLKEKLRELVEIACPAFHEGKGGHSPLGSPPYRETGKGYYSIRSQKTPDGAVVGTDPIVERLGKWGFNYLVYWDKHGRPWLSRWKELFLKDFIKIAKAAALKPGLYKWTWGTPRD